MTHPTRLAPFAAAAVMALGLAACGGDAPPQSPPDTITVTDTPTAEEASSPEQLELTKQQIAKALPTKEEAPDGFPEDPGGFDAATVSQRESDPEDCLAVYMDTQEMRDFRTEHVAAADGVRYTRKGDAAGQPSISVAVWSHDDPYPQEFFDEAGSALADCRTFTSTSSPGGSSSTSSATAIPTPLIGDQSFGVRIGDEEVDIAIDYLWVRSGHNLINVRMLTGFRQNNDEILEKYAKGVVDDLK